MLEDFNQAAVVRTVHILSTGALVWTREDYENIKDRFDWVDQRFILSEILRLRRLTDNGRQSIIAIYETGRIIKPFMNLDHDFHLSDLSLAPLEEK
jgi:hypothetical protein